MFPSSKVKATKSRSWCQPCSGLGKNIVRLAWMSTIGSWCAWNAACIWIHCSTCMSMKMSYHLTMHATFRVLVSRWIAWWFACWISTAIEGCPFSTLRRRITIWRISAWALNISIHDEHGVMPGRTWCRMCDAWGLNVPVGAYDDQNRIRSMHCLQTTWVLHEIHFVCYSKIGTLEHGAKGCSAERVGVKTMEYYLMALGFSVCQHRTWWRSEWHPHLDLRKSCSAYAACMTCPYIKCTLM